MTGEGINRTSAVGADGAFSFGELPAGSYSLTTVIPGGLSLPVSTDGAAVTIPSLSDPGQVGTAVVTEVTNIIFVGVVSYMKVEAEYEVALKKFKDAKEDLEASVKELQSWTKLENDLEIDLLGAPNAVAAAAVQANLDNCRDQIKKWRGDVLKYYKEQNKTYTPAAKLHTDLTSFPTQPFNSPSAMPSKYAPPEWTLPPII